MAFIIGTPTLETPQCIGKNIQEALRILSDCDLNAKLLEEKEDNDIPEGTIIAQRPTFKQKIKPHQTVFLVVSKKSKKIPTPNLVGKTFSEIKEELKKNNILHKNYPVPSEYPHDMCITQLPLAGQELHEKRVITYCALTKQPPCIFPDLTHKVVPEIISFLQKYSIIPNLSHSKKSENHICTHCTITDQRPMAGSVMYLNKSLDVHLHINHIEKK